jgi:3-oxoacyl-[acyl-carrier-protein] synthase-3
MMDYWDRNTCVLFGDGAGAAVFEASELGDGMLACDLGADGAAGSTMVSGALGTRHSLRDGRAPAGARLHFEGQAVFKIAVQGIVGSAGRALERAGLVASDIDLVIPHQANARIIESAARRLGIDPERVVVNIADHGNTSAGSVPMPLADAAAPRTGRRGDADRLRWRRHMGHVDLPMG